MRRIAIFSRTPYGLARMKSALKESHFSLDKRKPDVVVSYGGDGTYLRSEQKYPGIPKIILRDSKICKKCHAGPLAHVLDRLRKGKYRIKAEPKLEARIGRRRMLAVNEICVRNAEQQHAIRFLVYVDGKLASEEIIGDGAIVATPFGSSGYFYSVSHKRIKTGISIAMNNPTKKCAPLSLKSDASVQIMITRGDAFVSADNNPSLALLKQGQTITIKQSRHKAKIIEVR